jgi:hypothetical protein
VLDLILALANEAVARVLSSRIADRTLSRDLGILYSRADADLVNIASSIPLVELIVKNEPGAPTSNDADIWRTVFELVAGQLLSRLQLPSRKLSSIRRFDPALLLRRGLSRHTTRLTSESARSSQGESSIMLEGSLNDTLRGRHGRTKWGISTKSREPSIQRAAGADGQSLHFKVHFLSGL